MSPQGQDVSYEGTIKTLIHTQRGSYEDLSYLPAFRASGVFYAIVAPGISTQVCFMNYWREKNRIRGVGALVSIRDSEGKLVRRRYFAIEDYTYVLDVRALLGGSPHFVGTIEVELFSDCDLKFAFPALVVIYETAAGLSYVHTNQRIFNNAEDRRRAVSFNSWQTGFDVLCDEQHRSFVFIVNGPTPLKSAVADIRIVNSQGGAHDVRAQLGDLPPFGTYRLNLDELDGVAAFLGREIGFCKVNADLGDIYNRFGCGIERRDGQWLSITHSYFDCQAHDDYYDTAGMPGDILPCFIPVNPVSGLELEIVFYPIMARSKLRFLIECFDAKGDQLASVTPETLFEGDGSRMCRLNLSGLLDERAVADRTTLCCVHIEASDGKLPTRITFGLNYRSQSDRVGTNISSSALMASSHEVRRRSWLWGPLPCRAGSRNIIMISQFSRQRGLRMNAELTLAIYDAKGEVARRPFRTANRSGLNVVAEDMLAAAGYEPTDGDTLWYVVESTSSAYVANQIHISKSGKIGGDHSF